MAGTTVDKYADNNTVTNLAANTTYYFVVEAFTDSHVNNQNTVVSEYSTEVSAATFETPTLTITTPNDDSYQWNVPNVNKDKTQCLARIMTIDGTVVDTIDNYFTISKF